MGKQVPVAGSVREVTLEVTGMTTRSPACDGRDENVFRERQQPDRGPEAGRRPTWGRSRGEEGRSGQGRAWNGVGPTHLREDGALRNPHPRATSRLSSGRQAQERGVRRSARGRRGPP